MTVDFFRGTLNSFMDIIDNRGQGTEPCGTFSSINFNLVFFLYLIHIAFVWTKIICIRCIWDPEAIAITILR